MYGLAKIAASFDAQRNKQYWQMLKRLHGGSDEAVAGIKESGDDGIWHGTRAEFLSEIGDEGLKPGGFREFGVGTFFGSKEIAGKYGRDEARSSSGANMGNIWHGDKSINDPDEMADFVRKNPHLDYKLNEGALVRLVKPSELAGTKTLYPNPQNVKVFDMKDNNSLDKVAPSQTRYMSEHDDAIVRIKKTLMNKVTSGSEEEARPIIESAMRKNMEITDWLHKDRTPEEFEKTLQESVLQTMERVKSKKENSSYIVDMRLGEILAEKLMIPRNEKELHQLQTYGKLRGRRVFDRIAPENKRKEIFFDRQGVSPSLLRHEDGRKMTGDTLGTSPSNEAEVSQKTLLTDKSMWPYIGLGAAGVGATGGLAYLAHKKNKEKKQAAVDLDD